MRTPSTKLIKRISFWLSITLICILNLLAACTATQDSETDYSKNPIARSIIKELVKEEHLDKKALTKLLAQAQRQQSILDAISRPAEKTKEWYEYRPIFVNKARANKGTIFWAENEKYLALAEEQYGVPAEIIVAIIGVETNYGRNKGSYRVLDALATLAFDYPPRSEFFTKELKNYLLLTHEHQLDATSLVGSYAGAMGYPQFMPSSFRKHAVDFDHDGHIDFWSNPTDAIGSIANYLSAYGWQPGQPIATLVEVGKEDLADLANQSLEPDTTLKVVKERGISFKNRNLLASLDEETKISLLLLKQPSMDEYWVGFNNFYVITRYNHSRLYAMSVFQLASEIKQAKN